MRERGHNEAVDVGEDLFHRLTFVRRSRRKLCFQIARFDGREHRQVVDAIEVIGDPVNQFMTEPAKVFFTRITRIGGETVSRGSGSVHSRVILQGNTD